MTGDPVLIRIPDAARLLQISRSAAYALAQRGEIPTVVLGPRAIRVPRAALQRWIEERTTGGK
jgi:excisionase family DNA binding protein